MIDGPKPEPSARGLISFDALRWQKYRCDLIAAQEEEGYALTIHFSGLYKVFVILINLDLVWEMNRFAGSVRLRPVRVAFLVPPDDLNLITRAIQLSTCVWGGRYNPIIPFFESKGGRWSRPYVVEDGLEVARGYINFFEPDTLVETAPGMAEKLGWISEPHILELPRVLSLSDFYQVDARERVQFSAGIDIAEPMQELYDTEYKYERRHRTPFADIEQSAGNAFFDVFGGRFPADESLAYISRIYREVFSAEKLPASAETAVKILAGGHAGPLWVTRYDLEEAPGRSFSDETFYIFDPTHPGDVIDAWNYRLFEQRVIPINVQWLEEHKEFIRKEIADNHRPIPGNPYGTMFHSSVVFSASINDERLGELTEAYLADLPDGSFYPARIPIIRNEVRRGRNRRKSKILATSKAASFDESLQSERYVKIPALAPSFRNATHRYTKGHWVNLVSLDNLYQRADPATVYPSNIWSPKYPRLGNSGGLRIGREGWALHQETHIGYSLLEPQEGRASIVGWLKTKGIEAVPSEEGQIASRVIAVAETLLACGMFADHKTLQLLNSMAESHTEINRDGRRTVRATPDRSKRVREVEQHFKDREKRSFGYWNSLQFFLDRSVFRAGLSVQCPVCSYYNWFAVDDLSYKPSCSRCLNAFDLSQAPKDLHRHEWYYRITGPFSAPDFARGAYAVALTLRTLASRHDSNITWSTGLLLTNLNCEIDLIAWHRASGLGFDERDEPILVVGEAKSFGVGSITDKALDPLKKVAERFPGAVMVISSLREIGDYSLAEIGRLRQLALWGRRSTFGEQPVNPLIVLTGTELFAAHGISQAWKKIDEKELHAAIDINDLHTLAQLTQERYLGLEPYWDKQAGRALPASMNRLMTLIQGRAKGP